MSLSTPAESSRGSARTPSELTVRRLFSLSGVVPLGAWVVFHFLSLTRALSGPRRFSASLAGGSTLWLWVEALVIGVPLVFHGLYGLKLALASRINVASYPYARNWAHALQRASGVVALIFVLWHWWETRARVLLGDGSAQDFYTDLAGSLSSTGPFGIPFVALGYLAGVAAVSYHLANGVTGFSASFGLVTSQRALARVARYALLSGLVLFLIAAAVVGHFATGWTPFAGG
jgi:succinate dehydrogenase cytochrome b subunit